MHVLVCVCMHRYVRVQVCDYTERGQKLTLRVFLYCIPFYFLRQDLSLNLGLLIKPGWLASELQGSACLCLPITGITGVCNQP